MNVDLVGLFIKTLIILLLVFLGIAIYKGIKSSNAMKTNNCILQSKSEPREEVMLIPSGNNFIMMPVTTHLHNYLCDKGKTKLIRK